MSTKKVFNVSMELEPSIEISSAVPPRVIEKIVEDRVPVENDGEVTRVKLTSKVPPRLIEKIVNERVRGVTDATRITVKLILENNVLKIRVENENEVGSSFTIFLSKKTIGANGFIQLTDDEYSYFNTQFSLLQERQKSSERIEAPSIESGQLVEV